MIVGCSEKHSADVNRTHYPLCNTLYESRDATCLHMFYYLSQPRTNLNIKVGENAVLNYDARHSNLYAIDDVVENKANTV